MFRTELTIAPATGQLPRSARVLTVGSCFADSIGARLAANKVATLANPFGTVFQPLALGRLLRAAAGEEVDWQQHLVEARGRWQSYDLHGSIGADSPVELLQTIQELVRRTGEFLRQADVLLLTLGTAWAYRLRETGELVNNCHKQPADLFVRELLTPDELINDLAETHAYLRRINPELRFVLTVSPVRHLKDTLPMNSVSKSVLRIATHIVSDLLPGVAYFPAYELLLDDLRDYRFYAADMLHPSEVAEDYIWDKFAQTYFDADFGRFRKEWAAVRQSLEHRPLHAGAPEHRQFLTGTLEKLEQMNLRKVEVTTELNEVRARLLALPILRISEPLVSFDTDEERIDIGEDATAIEKEAIARLQATTTTDEGRPPRLSPEEFRAQRAARGERPERGRRDGRGKGQQKFASENEQFQAAPNLAGEDVETPILTKGAVPLAPHNFEQAGQIIELTDALSAPNEAENDDEPAKKKKRRSRGGAKRTARKNALRLAEGDLGQETDSANATNDLAGFDETSAVSESRETLSAERNPLVIAPDESVRRGGRRNEAGRVPRVALFTAGPVPDNATTSMIVDAEVAALPADAALVSMPVEMGRVAEPTADANSRNNRNNRNRNNRNSGNSAAAEIVSATPIGTAEQLSDIGTPTTKPLENRIDQGQQSSAAFVLPVPKGANSGSNSADVPTTARKPNRSKARAVSAARAEKPAIDTPLIPVSDVLQVRTQVAAGRMTGTSASLIKPTAAPKKAAEAVIQPAAAPKKGITDKTKTVKTTPALIIPVEVVSLPEAPMPAAKSKSAPKPKAKVAKIVAPEPIAAKATVAKPSIDVKIKVPTTRLPVVESVKGKLVAAKPVATKPVATKSVATKSVATKSVATKSVATKPVATKPVATKPVAAKPVAAKPVAAKPVAAKPAAPKSAATPKSVAAKAPAPKAAAVKGKASKPAATEPAPPKKPTKPTQ